MRAGVAGALRHIRLTENLGIKPAKRRFIRYVWLNTSPGLEALKRKRRGLPYGLKADRQKPDQAKVWRVTGV